MLRNGGADALALSHAVLRAIWHEDRNIADWVSRWGSSYEHMLVLDADSLMTGEAMVRLADAMERHPGAGLIQTMPMIINGQTIFARTLQFATRLYGRVAWTGLAWWSGSESSFWGHNAIVRTRAFAETCGLPSLDGPKPFGGEVMSHDALESALLRRGGWSVHLAPYLEGSYEESPSNLLDFATRDRRWCRGNVQHIPLVGLPGLHWMSRLHLVIGVLSYVLSPLWFMALSAGIVSRLLMPSLKKAAFTLADLQAAAHALIDWREIQATAWAMIITFVLLFGPKILGTILVFSRPEERKGFGGRRRIAAGLSVEMLLSALVAPMLMFTQTRALVEILAGKVGGWATQRRDADKVSGAEAFRAMGWISVTGCALALGFWFTPDLLTATAPILAGLMLAVPLTMLGAHKLAGLRVKANGLFMTPEERRPPAIVRAALDAGDRVDRGRRRVESPNEVVVRVDDEQLVRPLQELEHRRAHRVLGDPDQVAVDLRALLLVAGEAHLRLRDLVAHFVVSGVDLMT